MQTKEMNKLFMGGLGLLSSGTLLALICCILRGWIVRDDSTIESNWGLWSQCTTVVAQNTEVCDDIEDPAEWLEATRAFVILSILAGVATIGVSVFVLITTGFSGQSSNAMLKFAILGAGITTFVFQVIAIVIYGAEYEEEDVADLKFDLAHAFYLYLVGALFVVGGTLMEFFSCKQGQVSA